MFPSDRVYPESGLRSPFDPLARRQRRLHLCRHCGEGIYPGERHAFIDAAYHVDCLETLSTVELLGLLGIPVREED